jgi:hypothetical protein
MIVLDVVLLGLVAAAAGSRNLVHITGHKLAWVDDDSAY